jgi:xylose isomerase
MPTATLDRSSPLSFGVGLWAFGQLIDRYATDAYGPPVSTLEAIRRAGEVDDLSCVDINYPFDAGVTLEQVKAALSAAGLRAIAVTPHIYTRTFRRGAFTNPDPAVRRAAIELCKSASQIAHGLGATYVKLWPGQDGYDYPMQADYVELWDLTVQGMREVASSDPTMQYAIEYKFKEPRVHITLSTAARTLLAIDEMGVANIGIVMDMGHSLLAKETPAEEVQMTARRGRLVSVEINDNWREWDDDLSVGAVHIVESLEYLLALRTIGWQGPILLDQFPFREDAIEAVRHSIAMIRLLDSRLDRIDAAELRAVRFNQDAIAAQRLISRALFGV